MFDIENATIMSQYPREEDVFINITDYSGKSMCRLLVSNVLPKPMSPRAVLTEQDYKDEEECKKKAKWTDRELNRREDWALQTKDYYDMRQTQIDTPDSVFSNDHFSLQHIRDVYRGILDLEAKVVSVLYQRMEGDPCFQSVLDRYRSMDEELSTDPKAEWEQVKQRLTEQSRRYGRGDVVRDSDVNRSYNTMVDSRFNERSVEYINYQYFTDAGSVCDGCHSTTLNKHFNVTGAGPHHFFIRKWQGDREVFDISTRSNRRHEIGG